MDKSVFRAFHRLRVRWAEVDMQKIVFNGHYLMYFDTAVGDYWRALALPYEATMQGLGGDLYVKKSGLEYQASARYDDRLDVGMRCARIGTSSMLFEGGVFRGHELLVKGELLYVYANPATQRAQPVPDDLRAALSAFEAGEAMAQIDTGDWATLKDAAGPLRRAVFIDEQGVPEAMEWDDDDVRALHAVCRNRLGLALATGRLLPAGAGGVSRLGRMAVRRDIRGSGHGEQVLGALVGAARQRGDLAIEIHAQRSAEAFYSRAGFVAEGPTFDEAGMPHVAMRLSLAG